MNEYSLRQNNLSVSERFSDKSKLCRNEKVCRGVKCKAFLAVLRYLYIISEEASIFATQRLRF